MAVAKNNAAKTHKTTTKVVTVANPYREGGAYWTTVEALRGLGVDTLHPFESIIPAVKKVFGLNWSEFKNKDARNDNGKDAESRIVQNVGVVARKDYGDPLRECGYEVRFDGRQKVAGLFKIKATSKPQAKAEAVKAPKVAQKPKTAQKAAGKAPKAKKAK